MANKRLINVLGSPFDLVRDDLADLTTRNHSSLNQLTWSTTGHTIDTTFSPNADASRALGTTALRWTNLFLSGSILDSSSAQIYIRRSGADTLTGNWSTGTPKFLINTTAASGQVNILASSVPAVTFDTGTTSKEVLWQSQLADSAGNRYGWQMFEEDAATGDLYLARCSDGTNYVNILRFDRGDGHIALGAYDTGVNTNGLELGGLLRTHNGAHFNYDQGNNNFVVSSALNTYQFYVDGVNSGVAINGTTTTGGVFTLGAGRTAITKAGAAGAGYAGFNIATVTTSGHRCLIQWTGVSSYTSTASAYGWGWVQDDASTGDHYMIVRDGTTSEGEVMMYFDRNNSTVGSSAMGIGNTFAWNGTKPSYLLHVGGTFGATSATLSGLTAGRVVFAGTGGLLTDDADFTFATDTLTATKIVGTTSVKVGTAAGYISSDGSTGATGSFTTVDGKTVTVKDGIITSIV